MHPTQSQAEHSGRVTMAGGAAGGHVRGGGGGGGIEGRRLGAGGRRLLGLASGTGGWPRDRTSHIGGATSNVCVAEPGEHTDPGSAHTANGRESRSWRDDASN